jgi:UDP-glucose 4-epimerase
MPEPKALVTGGAGFIGSHLAEKLLQRGYLVHVVDDLSTGSLDNISHLDGEPHFRYTVDSILNAEVMGELIGWSDVVFHLAAAVGVEYVIENQLRALEVNVRGAEVVFSEAEKSKTKVVLFSTSEIYGKSVKVPFKEEDDSLMGPTTLTRWSYAVTKALDEILALAYRAERDLPVVILRVFNTCGPRQTGRYGMVVPRFVSQALSGEPIRVFGDGSQTRCFASVSDVVEGVVNLAECERAVGEIFNIGSDREISIRDLAQTVKQLASSESAIEFVPYDKAYGPGFEDMMRRMPDLSKIRSFIGYEQRVDLEGIIGSVIDYFRLSAGS